MAQNDSACQICGGSGWYRKDVDIYDPDFGEIFECECQLDKRIQRVRDMQAQLKAVLDTALRPDDFLERGPGSRRMAEVGREFLANPIGLITVYGHVAEGETGSANGNGKSTWAQILVNECVKSGMTAFYLTASDLMRYVNGGMRDPKNNVDRRMDTLANAAFLVIDELTQPRWTEWVSDILTTIIDRRYKRADAQGTLLVMDEHPSVLPQRLVSRIWSGVVIKNSDTDMRPGFGKELN